MKSKDFGLFWLVGLIWGTSFVWIKTGVAEISSTMLVAYRALIGALGLGVIIAFNKKVSLKWETIKPHLGTFFILGLLNITLPWSMISYASNFIDSGMSAVINGTMPLFTILLSFIFVKDDRVTFAKAAGLVIGFLGVVVLLLPKINLDGAGTIIYYVISMAAPLLYAVAVIFARKRAADLPSLMQAFLQLAMAAIQTWAWAFLIERPMVQPAQPITWVALVWLGILGSCIAYIIYFYLLHRIGPTLVSMITYIPPLVGMVLGIVFLGEQFFWLSLVGALMIMGGIMIGNLGSKETA